MLAAVVRRLQPVVEHHAFRPASPRRSRSPRRGSVWCATAAGGGACKRPGFSLAAARRPQARTGLDAATSARSRRSAAPSSSAVSPARLDGCRRPQPCQAVEAVLASQGRASIGLHNFSCSARCRGSGARGQVGQFAADGRWPAHFCLARRLRQPGTQLLQFGNRVPAGPPGPSAARGSPEPPGSIVGRGELLLSPRGAGPLNWRAARRCCDCRRPAPGSAAALQRHVALLVALPPARRANLGVPPGQQVAASSSCRACEHFALFSAAADLLGDAGSSSSASPWRSPTAGCARLQLDGFGAAPFRHVADALSKPAHSSTLGQHPCARVQLVADGVVRLADRFQLASTVAQLGLRRLGARAFRCRSLTRFLAGRVAVLEEPQLVQLELAACCRPIVLLWPPRPASPACRGWLVEFAQDVVPTRGQVLARVLQAVLGLCGGAPCAETPAASSRNRRSSSGLGFDDAADRALADDGVGARPEARCRGTRPASRRRTGWLLM